MPAYAKYLSWIVCGLLLMSLTHSVFANESKLVQFIPNDDEIAGWMRDGELAVATDEGSLSGLINGAAPFYMNHGTVEVIFQDYSEDDLYLTLEIYRLNTQEQAGQI